MRLSTTRRAWARWQMAAGSWQGWSVCPALLAPEAAAITPRKWVPVAWADRLAAVLAGTLQPTAGQGSGGTAIVLDLQPELAVYLAARLNQFGLANAVLVLPRWPYRQAILPADGLLHGLVSESKHLAPGGRPNVAFALDAERTRAVAHRARNDERADNRYRLTAADLPNLTELRARGITRVVKLSRA